MQSIIVIVHVNEITELNNDFSSINLEVVFFSIDFFCYYKYNSTNPSTTPLPEAELRASLKTKEKVQVFECKSKSTSSKPL